MKKALTLKLIFRVEEEQIAAVEMVPHPQACQWMVKGVCSAALKKDIDRWMEYYLARKVPPRELPINLEKVPPYTREVLEALRKVPFGQKRTYGELAKQTGRPQAARAVGGACGRNPVPLLIPCHRIVGVGGAMRGFSAGGTKVKKLLLQHESDDE